MFMPPEQLLEKLGSFLRTLSDRTAQQRRATDRKCQDCTGSLHEAHSVTSRGSGYIESTVAYLCLETTPLHKQKRIATDGNGEDSKVMFRETHSVTSRRPGCMEEGIPFLCRDTTLPHRFIRVSSLRWVLYFLATRTYYHRVATPFRLLVKGSKSQNRIVRG